MAGSHLKGGGGGGGEKARYCVQKHVWHSLGPSSNIFHVFFTTGVALLPFVDEKRLLGALSKVYPDLTDIESKLKCSISFLITMLHCRWYFRKIPESLSFVGSFARV